MHSRKIFILSFIFIAVLCSFCLTSTEVHSQEKTVYIAEINDESINSGTSHFVGEALSLAERHSTPLIIKLDTPGGLLRPTKEIVDGILNSNTTVVCWVSPEGAYAYSAGTYILMSSDIAVMDKATTIGAAEPQPHDNKTVEAMSGWIREIAESRGRPGSIAEEFVIKNRTMGVEEALQENMIDLIATSNDEVLEYLELPSYRLEKVKRSPVGALLGILSTPQVAIILLIIGMLGIAAEIVTGGVGFPGIAGGFCLLLALIGLMVLEISVLGLILTILGVILLGVELFEPGFGVFGIAGAIMLFLGVLIIGEEPWVQISGIFVKIAAVCLVAIFVAFIWVVKKSTGKEIKTGMESMVGMEGEVVRKIDPEGVIRVRGERWSAVSDVEIEEGEEVVVKSITRRGGVTTLVVEKKSEV